MSDTSAQECTSACAYLNQSYAATEDELCFCSNGPYDKYGPASSDSLCDLVCSDPGPCNDTSHIRVFSTQDAIGGLEIQAPKVGWLLREVNFSVILGKGKGKLLTDFVADFTLVFLAFFTSFHPNKFNL